MLETRCLREICCAASVSGAALANPGRVPSCIAQAQHVGERFRKWEPPMGAGSDHGSNIPDHFHPYALPLTQCAV